MSYYETPTCFERMESALSYHFGNVKNVNDYKVQLGDLFTEMPQRKDVATWPAVVLNHEINRPDGENDDKVSSYQSVRYWSSYSVLIFDRADSEDLNTPQKRKAWRANVIGDVTKMLLNNAGLVSETNEQTSFTIKMGSNKGFDRIKDEAYVGVAIRFLVRWGHDELDPTTFTF